MPLKKPFPAHARKCFPARSSRPPPRLHLLPVHLPKIVLLLLRKSVRQKKQKGPRSKSTSKAKNVEKSATSTTPCESQAEPPVIEVPSEQIVQPKQNQTALQTIRSLSAKMESVEQVADAEGMLSEVASAADTMIYRLDVCFENYPEFLKNPKIRQKVVGLLQKAKDYIVKLEGEFAYD